MISLMAIIWGLVSILLFMLSLLLARKSYMDREKLSPFECGFDPFSSSRVPFSLRFYLIALIFLIFDVEIVLILPIVPLYSVVTFSVWLMVSFAFVAILLMGLYYEWALGALNWS